MDSVRHCRASPARLHSPADLQFSPHAGVQRPPTFSPRKCSGSLLLSSNLFALPRDHGRGHRFEVGGNNRWPPRASSNTGGRASHVSVVSPRRRRVERRREAAGLAEETPAGWYVPYPSNLPIKFLKYLIHPFCVCPSIIISGACLPPVWSHLGNLQRVR